MNKDKLILEIKIDGESKIDPLILSNQLKIISEYRNKFEKNLNNSNKIDFEISIDEGSIIIVMAHLLIGAGILYAKHQRNKKITEALKNSTENTNFSNAIGNNNTAIGNNNTIVNNYYIVNNETIDEKNKAPYVSDLDKIITEEIKNKEILFSNYLSLFFDYIKALSIKGKPTKKEVSNDELNKTYILTWNDNESLNIPIWLYDFAHSKNISDLFSDNYSYFYAKKRNISKIYIDKKLNKTKIENQSDDEIKFLANNKLKEYKLEDENDPILDKGSFEEFNIVISKEDYSKENVNNRYKFDPITIMHEKYIIYEYEISDDNFDLTDYTINENLKKPYFVCNFDYEMLDPITINKNKKKHYIKLNIKKVINHYENKKPDTSFPHF